MKNLLLVFIISLSLFLVIRYLTGCQKELHDNAENTVVPAGDAIFSLAGAPGNCENAIINGTFIAGIKTPPANNVLLTVNVSSAGKYHLYTDTIDGISFSGSGIFTEAGNQKLLLNASGTPASTGTLTFTPSTDSESCKFSVNVVDSGTMADFILISGNGDPGPCSYSVTGNFISGRPMRVTENVTIHIAVNQTGNFIITTNEVNGMIFSASGTFIAIGRQVIPLFGSGTPINKGTYSFTPKIIIPKQQNGNDCTFNVTVE